MAQSPVVDSLPAYVEQRTGLVAETILAATSAKLFTLQAGVKGTAAINKLTNNVKFGNGAACGWTEAGTSELTQRNIVTGQIKVNMGFCDKTLVGKWAEYDVRVAAGQKTLPFEQDFIDNVVAKTGEALETAIWQGDTTSSDVNLNKFDGVLKIAGADSAVVDVTLGGTDPVADVKAILTKIAASKPELLNASDLVLFCSPEFMVAYGQALIAANLYHYNPEVALDDILIPGTKARLVAVGGLIGQHKVLATTLSNIYFGCDTADDASKFEFWYSQDNREFRLAIEFNAGVNYAFSDEVFLGSWA